MDAEREFFRTKIWLENGERVYMTADRQIVYRSEQRRKGVEAVQRVLMARGEWAFSPMIGDLRPAWMLPPDAPKTRVVGFANEAESEPLDAGAHLTTGENVSESTHCVYLS